MIRSRAGRNRSFCRSSRGFDIASPEQSPLDQGITIRLKSESQIARNPSPIPPFRQNRLLAQARLSLCPSDIQILHGRRIDVVVADENPHVLELSFESHQCAASSRELADAYGVARCYATHQSSE